MVITGVPVRVRVGIRQQCINQDAKAFGVRVQVTQLGHRINHAAATGATCQPDNDVKSHFCLAALLQLLDLCLHLFAVIAHLAGKQKAAQPAFLPTQRRSHNAVQNVAPVLRAAQPVLQAGVAGQIIQPRAQVGISDQQLAGLGQLHRRAQCFPAWVVHRHHLAGGINVQIANVNVVGFVTVKLLVQTLAQRTNDLAPCTAQPDDKMIHLKTPMSA